MEINYTDNIDYKSKFEFEQKEKIRYKNMLFQVINELKKLRIKIEGINIDE